MLSTCHHQVEFYDSFIFSGLLFNLQGSFYILTITNLWYFLLGKVPFVRANNFVIAELDPIIGFINTKVNKLLFKYQTLFTYFGFLEITHTLIILYISRE